ncbi:MAG: acyltransferase [Planctomycetaceae bacterium]
MSGANGVAPARKNRLHGFDAVRGLAAVAVVALHAAYPYIRFPMPGLVWAVPVDEPNRLADGVFWWIEGSVMPLFFTLSGYFLAQSLVRQPPSDVLAGRSRRLLLPMATVGLAVLAADLHVWAYGLISTGRATFREYLRMKYSPEIQANLWGPAHLWYVEYLWLLCLLVCTAAWFGQIVRNRTTVEIPGAARPILITCGFAALFGAAVLVLMRSPEVVLGFQHGWLPAPAKFAHSAIFLMFGILFALSGRTVELTRNAAPLSLLAAGGIFVVLLPRIHETLDTGRVNQLDPVLGLLLALFAVTATLGHIGAGLRWLDRPNPMLARLAAVSFWVYLVHHPVLGGLQILARPLPLPPAVKFVVIFAATMAVCLVSYRRLVEGRVAQRLLDGEWPWRAFRRDEPTVVQLPEQSPMRRAA